MKEGFLTDEEADAINDMILSGIKETVRSKELDFKIEALRKCLAENLKQMR